MKVAHRGGDKGTQTQPIERKHPVWDLPIEYIESEQLIDRVMCSGVEISFSDEG